MSDEKITPEVVKPVDQVVRGSFSEAFNNVMGIGDMAALADGATIPDGWVEMPELATHFIPGPVPEGARLYGEMSEANARAAVDRFMAGEMIDDLARAYLVPSGVIEGAIRWFASVED